MSIDSKNIGYKFLSEDYSKRQDDEEWKNRRTPPNAFEKTAPWDEKTAFQVAVPSSLQEKMDGVQAETQITELPPGYSIVMTLYKDQEFMTSIRFQRKSIVDAYLNEYHPLVVSYLKAHGLRVISQVVGLNDVDRRKILLASKDDDGDAKCVVASSAAVAVVSGGASAVAAASAGASSAATTGAVAAAVAAASASAGAVACAVGNVAGSDAGKDKDKDKDAGKDKGDEGNDNYNDHGNWR